MKFFPIILSIWILYFTYIEKQFIEKINSLPKETVQNSKIQFNTTNRPYYILYWID